MLKVLIIDDEPIVREGLKTIIDWEECGLQVCGEGVDGFDGLKKVDELCPDLILVDIRMPGMDGLEFVGNIRNKGVKSKIIILTGYSDFKYTQQAIDYGVNSYLLKPIDEDELIKIVGKLVEELKQDRENERLIKDGKELLREKLLADAIMGDWNIEFADRVDELLSENFLYYQMALITGTGLMGSSSTNYKAFKLISNTLSGEENMDLIYIENVIGVIFKGNSAPVVNMRVLKSIQNTLKRELAMEVFLSLGKLVDSIDNIREAYDTSREILNNKFFFSGADNIVQWEKADCFQKAKDEARPAEIMRFVEKLYASIELDNKGYIDDTAREVAEFFSTSGLSSDMIKGLFTNMIFELAKKLSLNYPELKNELPTEDSILFNIYSKNSLQELAEFLKKESLRISQSLAYLSSSSKMKKILDYINKNYEKELRLEFIAEIFSYNSSYLGKIFKTHTGVSFNTYLDEVRIEKAKELLNLDFKVYQVSEKVGFKNIDYFTSKFKKYCGLSPSEYKKK